MSPLSSSLLEEPYKQAQTLGPLFVEVERALRCCAGLKIARKRGDGSRRHERTTHDFLAALNTSLYLRDIPLSIVVHRVYLALPEYGERLLRREFSRAKACLRPARHRGDSGGWGRLRAGKWIPPIWDRGERARSVVSCSGIKRTQNDGLVAGSRHEVEVLVVRTSLVPADAPTFRLAEIRRRNKLGGGAKGVAMATTAWRQRDTTPKFQNTTAA